MVPHQFFTFFEAASAAAGALVGLLFVAISLRTDSILGEEATPAGRAMAGSSFIGLANGFLVSLVALIPQTPLGSDTAVVALVALVATVRLHRRLSRLESHLLMLAASVLSFVVEFSVGIALAVRPHNTQVLIALAYLVVVSLVVALIRAWALLQGRHVAAPAGTSSSDS